MGDLREYGEGRRPRSSRTGQGLLLLALGVMVAGAAGLIIYRSQSEPPGPARPLAPRATQAAARAPVDPLPPAAETDAQVRSLVSTLSRHREFAGWLLSEDLLRRFAAAVNSVALGQSPRAHLPFLAPEAPFAVTNASGHAYVDAASFRRYDRIVQVLTDIDPQQAAAVYTELAPLLVRAHAELGTAERTWEETLTQAFSHLVYAPVPMGRIEVVQRRVLWELADERLEALSPAQKHLVRMGPKNAPRLQSKLREIAGAMGLLLKAPPGEKGSGTFFR